MRTGDKTQFGVPGPGKGAASRAAGGCVCEEPGRGTILSTYNASLTCWMHEPPPFRISINRVMKG
jgi:hypothetical protein